MNNLVKVALISMFIYGMLITPGFAQEDNREAEYFGYIEKLETEKPLNLEIVIKTVKLANKLHSEELLTLHDALETGTQLYERVVSEYLFEQENGKVIEFKDYLTSISTDNFINELTSLSETPNILFILAKLHYVRGDKNKAFNTLEEAINLEKDINIKAHYLESFSMLISNSPKEAIAYAKRAISKNPNNGMAYIALGLAYMGIKTCGEDIVSKKSVYWLATDSFNKAKLQDPNLADLANKGIMECAKNYPAQSDAFYLDIVDGQKYKVNCENINEETIVRTIKY